MRRYGGIVAAVLVLVCGIFFVTSTYAQPQPLKEGQEQYWKLQSFRHGPNYFKITNLKETTPLVPGEWDFKHYHLYSEMLYWFKRWAQEYPNLIDVYVGGTSFEGRDIYQVTLTNKATGPDTDKPGMMLDANRHAGEVTAAESAFWMLHYMLVSYGKDKEMTRLIDKYAFYFRPKNNPDGSELYLNTAQTLRSTVHPFDEDRDGLLDEDPPNDLDGDGFIRQVRIKVPKGEGNLVTDPRDPKGRLMMTAQPGEGIYRLLGREGLDDDGDGRIDEDGIGGLDLHRNYVENWRPMPGLDLTGRGYTQSGAGDYPLSEPETRSLVVFLLEHPNIGVANSMDTSVPMHLRPPSTSPSEERMYPEDLEYYKYFDTEGKKLSGYARAGDVFRDYGGNSPLFGHGPDFGYWYYGAIWYGDELWNSGNVGDYNKDGIVNNDLDKLLYNDKELSVSRFKPWTPGKHPIYGDVEYGGWDGKFWGQNPPPDILEIWAEKEARFNLMLAKSMPDVIINEPKIAKGDSNKYTITVEIENKGYLPTALQQAQLVKIVRSDMVYIDFPEGMVGRGGGGGRGGAGGGAGGGGRGGAGVGAGGGRGGAGVQPPVQQPQPPPKVQFTDPRQTGSVNIDRIKGGEKKTVTFTVKLNEISSVEATIRYSSTRGGVLKKKITIGG
jgi:hypothetical protein